MSDESLNVYLDWLDKCAEEETPLSHRIRETIGPYKENADPVASAWADEIEELELELYCLRRGIKEWDFSNLPDKSMKCFLNAAKKGVYICP